MKFSQGDKVKVNGEHGRAEATVVGFDAESGKYRLQYHAVQTGDGKVDQQAEGYADGYADGKQMTKRRKS